MKQKQSPAAILFGLILMSWPNVALAAAIDEIVSAARKEGIVELYATNNLGPKGADELGAAFNKKYGLNISLRYSAGPNFTADVAKVITRAAAGVPPEWDVMAVTDAHHGSLWLRKLHERFDYRKLNVDPKVIHYDNGVVSYAHQLGLPAYNKNVLPPQDVPTAWEDLLAPKWKGGKLGMSTMTHHLARLGIGPWGEEKTTGFVRALANQKPILGPPGEIYNRLQIGEVLIAITLTDTYIYAAKRSGAPLVFAEKVNPVVAPGWQAGVLKGTQHPNVGFLFVSFLTSPEAQQVWEKYTGQTSAFIPGTSAHRFAQGRKMVYMSQEQAQLVDRLDREYAKILGFR